MVFFRGVLEESSKRGVFQITAFRSDSKINHFAVIVKKQLKASLWSNYEHNLASIQASIKKEDQQASRRPLTTKRITDKLQSYEFKLHEFESEFWNSQSVEYHSHSESTRSYCLESGTANGSFSIQINKFESTR